jgi:putative cardiolipin synthase
VTTLEQWITPQVTASNGRSGFRLLPTGLDAFVARATLIDHAERTLDLQYYIFHPDQTGSLVVDRLVAAADRGVSVRLLLDDWGTADKNDAAVQALDSHPNIEIKLFNPAMHRRGLGRLAELALRFARVNRRMHNKQLIADHAAVVLGGRNIGDEYFSLGELDFQDLDVLGLGPVAGQSTRSFEAYWNSEFAVPVARIGTFTPNPQHNAATRERLRQRCALLADSMYATALASSSLATELRTRALRMHWADARIIADPPDKLKKAAGTRSDRFLEGQIATHVRSVRSSMLVVSPYFVPGKDGVAFFVERRRAGVDVQILTNSLAATDVWLVHAGYMKYRRPLLDAGVRIYELRSEAAGASGPRSSGIVAGSSRASLHAKTFVFDRTSVFIGSVNLDPRSLEQNTEVGVLVQCPELAAEVADLFDRWTSPRMSYEVTRAPDGGLAWTGGFTKEPNAGFWRPLGAKLFSHLPIESLI